MTSEAENKPAQPDDQPAIGRAKVGPWVPDWREISDRLKIPRWRGQAAVPQQPAASPVSPAGPMSPVTAADEGAADPATKPAAPKQVVSGRAAVPSTGPAPRAAAAAPPYVPPKPPRTLSADDRRRRNRRRRWLGVAMSLLVVLLGLGFIGGSYFYDTVPRPDELTLVNSTEVFAADGTQIAKLGAQNRSEVAMARLPKQVKDALIAGEDKNFYHHHGIDMRGIARAAWNNLTGGPLQGASTITQQYARHAANDLDISYARKLREAVMARKLEDQYSKEEILGFYLNTVYFGRGAYGIGAAAEVYFGIAPDKIETMTVAQAAVLGAVLKQPEPDGNAKGFDPQNDLDAAKSRWHYVLSNMIEQGWLSSAERASLSYPEVRAFDSAKSPGSFGYTNSGTGYVIEYIASELQQRGVVDWLNQQELGNWKNAGLRITTTIDSRAQRALEEELNRSVAESTMSKQKDNIIGAGVAINPKNGQVIAYYGGTNNGTGTDWASADQPHPGASSFKIYTLAAALSEGYTAKSFWNSRELKAETDGYNLTNANREGDPTCDQYCTLEEMTIKSFNVPFFDIARKITPQKVIETAHKAGIRTMWTEDNKPHDLSKGIPGRDVFDYYAGIGQYPITVLDHAVGTATLANHGIRHDAHFVLKVERKNRKSGKWEHLSLGDPKAGGRQVIDAAVADEVTSVLKQIPGDAAVAGEGRESAGKTGTWENAKHKDGSNAHVWFTGYTTQIAATIWVGSRDVNNTPIKTVQGNDMGSLFPRGMWKRFMDKAHEAMKLPPEPLPAASGHGEIEVGTGVTPSPSPSPSPEPEPTPTPDPSTLPPSPVVTSSPRP